MVNPFEKVAMMIKKKILNPDRIRRIHGGFSFIPHRFLSRWIFGHRCSKRKYFSTCFWCSPPIAMDSLFTATTRFAPCCKWILTSTSSARNGLIDKDLIAFDGTVFQVLELPATPVVSPTPFYATEKNFIKPLNERSRPTGACSALLPNTLSDTASSCKQ
jgi:hypothetical protein